MSSKLKINSDTWIDQQHIGSAHGSADRLVLNNTGGGTAQQCAAFLDAATLQDADVDTGTGTYNGKKGRVWYSRNASGKVLNARTTNKELMA